MEKIVISQKLLLILTLILLTYLIIILFEEDMETFDNLETILIFRNFRLHM